jgi:RNA polymerase sigma factor (sigma-70 family)
MDSQKSQNISRIVQADNEKLKRFISFRVRAKEDAEDILQDVYYRLADSIDDIRSVDAVTSWLYMVAKNRIADFFKKKKPVAESQLGKSSENELTLDDLFKEYGASPEDEFMRGEIIGAVEESLDLIPKEQRDAFVMNEIEGLSFKEISEKTGVPVNTLISRKRYAIQFLRDYLKEIFEELN